MLELSACCLASGVKELYIYETVKNIPPGKVRPGRGSRKHIWPPLSCSFTFTIEKFDVIPGTNSQYGSCNCNKLPPTAPSRLRKKGL